MNKKVISRKAAAKILGCNPQTISNYISKGLLHKVDNGLRNIYVYEKEVLTLFPFKEHLESTEQLLKDYITDIEKKEKELKEVSDDLLLEINLKRKGLAYSNNIKKLLITCTEVLGDELSYKERNVMNLFLDGCRFSEIAIQNDIKIEQVRNIIARSIWKLHNVKKYHENIRNLQQKVDMLELENKELQKRVEKYQESLCVKVNEQTLNWEGVDLSTKIRDCNLSVRALKACRNNDINTLLDLCQMEESEILKFKNVGRHVLRELDELLEDNDLSFGMKISVRQGKYIVIDERSK